MDQVSLHDAAFDADVIVESQLEDSGIPQSLLIEDCRDPGQRASPTKDGEDRPKGRARGRPRFPKDYDFYVVNSKEYETKPKMGEKALDLSQLDQLLDVLYNYNLSPGFELMGNPGGVFTDFNNTEEQLFLFKTINVLKNRYLKR